MQFDEETWENLEMRAIILTAALRTDLIEMRLNLGKQSIAIVKGVDNEKRFSYSQLSPKAHSGERSVLRSCSSSKCD